MAVSPSPDFPTATHAAAGPLLGGVWHVRVLGGLEARNGDLSLTHFVSHPIAALLARLALQPQRIHPREELVELLWPGVDIDVGRNRLRNAISSLRRLLEPPGTAAGSVLVADRQGVQMAPQASRCDAIEFERCVRERRLDEARRWYGGELLPGFYEDWVQDERARIAALHERVDAALPLPAGPMAESPVDASGVRPMPAAGSLRTLPGYLTSYFGREPERAQLSELIAAGRLVTLTGMGGCGKTRLAVEVARRVDGFDFVAFVALAECGSESQCAAQLRVALQLPPSAADPIDQVVTFLSGSKPLLVLDNFEQLVAGGGLDVVEPLLERLPALHLLVTSRRTLGVPGEREFPLVPLPQPDPRAGLQDVARSPSVALFVDRARAVRPDFQVTERNHEALAELCCALEGVPLAIELAASRSRAFSPSDMHAALAQRFSLLARPASSRSGRTVLRHDTLRAAIDWSWQLLAFRQQRFLMSLSVFRGGCTAASAQAVCEEPEAHALLEQLASDSLLRSEVDPSGAMRFSMLEMIRDFLRERLDPRDGQALRQQHRAHYLAIAVGQQARGAPAIDEGELSNFHEALRSAVDDGENELALTLALALRAQWERNGISPEALGLLNRALLGANKSDSAWIASCTMGALLTLSAGDAAAAQKLADAALAQAPPKSVARAAALSAGVRVASESHRNVEGLFVQLEEAIAISVRAGAIDVHAQCLALMGMLVLRQNQGKGAERADALACEARRLYQSIGQEREASALLYERTMCLLELRRYPEALAQARIFESESIALGDRHRRLKAINLQGVVQANLRLWGDAVASYRRCAQLAWEMHNHYWLVFALWNHGRNLARLRQPDRAALLMAFSERYWVSHFGELAADDRRFVRQVRALVRCQVGSAKLDVLWREGLQLSMAQAVRLALT